MARLACPDGYETVLAADAPARLERLLGFPCAADPNAPDTAGLIALRTSRGDADATVPTLAPATERPDGWSVTLEWPGLALRLTSVWTLDPDSRVLARADTLTNRGDGPVTIHRCLARFPLAAGRVRAYLQASRWGIESQGGWFEPPPGEVVLTSDLGRTAAPATPYLFLLHEAAAHGLALHVLPRGNWTIRLARRGGTYDGKLVTVIEAGLADGALALGLGPGESLALPELLWQAVPEAEPRFGAAPLHAWAHRRWFAAAKPSFPVQYNTWFDRYDTLDPDRLRRQLAAAKGLGCEVFTVDAGWFGAEDTGWSNQVGDWRESVHRSFQGGMRAFADEVRAAGLAFGLWMEAERVTPSAPVARDRKDLLVPAGHGCFRFDLERPEAFAYLKAEMTRVIRTYDLAWIKLDSNFPLGLDPRGRELEGYYAAWFRLLDEMRREHPGTVFEACSSGALRLDLHLLARHDAGFLSDNVSVMANLRLLQGTALRVPPARIPLWVVLRSFADRGLCGSTIHGFEPPVPVDADFALLVNLPGILTFSGDPQSFAPVDRDRIAARVAWYKRWRAFIAAAATHLLTPPAPLADESGWAGYQLSAGNDPRHLVFAYRLDDPWSGRRFPLRGLDPARRYRIGGSDVPAATMTGAELADRGLPVELPARFRAAVVELAPES